MKAILQDKLRAEIKQQAANRLEIKKGLAFVHYSGQRVRAKLPVAKKKPLDAKKAKVINQRIKETLDEIEGLKVRRCDLGKQVALIDAKIAGKLEFVRLSQSIL